MPAPEVIHRLVDQFRRNYSTYKSDNYNEAQLRQEFLNPFFEALGWDVANKKGWALQYREVIHEDRVEIDGSKKAPDYAFRVGGVRKFFVEAKKPAENIEMDASLAYQLRRYAWNAHLPLSILTDFEEFAVYDCRNKPKPDDSPATSRIMLLRFEDYLDRWDEIVEIFSRDSILRGDFDRFAEDNTGKRGTIKVDDAFLADIEEWRLLLARNIALRNPQVEDERQLNFAVQMTIDRLIFLRICEDRQIEEKNQLLEISQKPDIYANLIDLFYRADLRYNSGLFHFKSEKRQNSEIDSLSPTLVIDDKVLKEIIKDLYYPSPYIFNEIPVEILGQVYEQFLGKVIRLTSGHRAKVEEKPEVRKAGGVYYTPKYIVDYIVENTVGELVKGKTPKQVAKLSIVDPACGSGSFLLGAFQYLLNWHEKWYLEHSPEDHAEGEGAAVAPAADGGWRISTAEKKRILLNNIYGVDIDPQAVEVTKLSLLLKVLEGETGQLSLGFERVLPDLGANIQCGNSLIGPDYYDGKQIGLFNQEEMFRINAFDWQRAFPTVFAQGGFDAVIGNPPYGAFVSKEENSYLDSHNETFGNVKDVYTCFIEKGIQLLNTEGILSLIVPSSWTGGPKYRILRHYLLQYQITDIVLLPFDVFKDAYIDTLIFTVVKQRSTKNQIVHTFVYPKREKIISISDLDYDQIKQMDWVRIEGNKFILDPNSVKLLSKFSEEGNFQKLIDIVEMKRGVYFTKSLLSDKPKGEDYHPYFEGQVYRYRIDIKIDNWVAFNEEMKEKPRDFFWFEGKRILLRRLVNRRQRLMAVIVEETFITDKNLYSIISKGVDIRFILGIINSKLLSYLYITEVTQASKDDFPQVTIRDILNLPLPKTETKNQITNKICNLVDRIIVFNKNIGEINTPGGKTHLQRRIDATDAEIDRLVYELYGLTEDEICIVEESVG